MENGFPFGHFSVILTVHSKIKRFTAKKYKISNLSTINIITYNIFIYRGCYIAVVTPKILLKLV